MLITKTTTDLKDIFKARAIGNYSAFIEGDYEASNGKTIETLIVAAESFIVYIDDKESVEWAYNEKFKELDGFLKKFGLILNKISYLEELSKGKLHKDKLRAFRRLLGESMGRLLDEKDDENALTILNQAEDLLNSDNRFNIIKSALACAVVIVITQTFLWLNKNCFGHYKPLVDIYLLAMATLSGGIGAFISLMIRSNKLEIEPTLGPYKYYSEGMLRVIYGIISAFVIYLAFSSKVILTNYTFNTTFVILICFVSGISEKMLPGVIKKLEDGL